MGARSVTKGKEFEREVASDMRGAMPGCNARRGLCQSRGGGAESADVVVPFFHVECKRGKRPNIPAAIEQAIADCAGGDHLWPLVVSRADRQYALATMPLSAFLDLVQEWYILKMGVSGNVT